MKQFFKKNLKKFLLMAFGYGCLMLVFDYLSGKEIHFIRYLILGISFVIIMSVLNVVSHWYNLKKKI